VEVLPMSTPETAALAGRAAATIAAVARTMYPHDAVPDEVYERVSAKLAESAADDAGTARTIEQGVAGLEGFAERSADGRLAALKAIEGSEFFELVRSTAVVEVYSDPRTWAAFGYQGPSFDKGGYLNRGFDDLDWLPDPAGDES
jgi:hypothetical protein